MQIVEAKYLVAWGGDAESTEAQLCLRGTDAVKRMTVAASWLQLSATRAMNILHIRNDHHSSIFAVRVSFGLSVIANIYAKCGVK